METYTESELRNQGYEDIRTTDGTYLWRNYGNGREILFKRIDGRDMYMPHGARDVEFNVYGPDEIESLEADFEKITDLEEFLLNPQVLAHT